jgi:type IV pilus assembly protein PilV
MSTSTNSENRNRAAMLAGEVASQMWLNNTIAPGTTAYNNLISNAGDQTQGGVPGGVISVVTVSTNAADVTVTWQEKSDANLSTLTTRVILP